MRPKEDILRYEGGRMGRAVEVPSLEEPGAAGRGLRCAAAPGRWQCRRAAGWELLGCSWRRALRRGSLR